MDERVRTASTQMRRSVLNKVSFILTISIQKRDSIGPLPLGPPRTSSYPRDLTISWSTAVQSVSVGLEARPEVSRPTSFAPSPYGFRVNDEDFFVAALCKRPICRPCDLTRYGRHDGDSCRFLLRVIDNTMAHRVNPVQTSLPSARDRSPRAVCQRGYERSETRGRTF